MAERKVTDGAKIQGVGGQIDTVKVRNGTLVIGMSRLGKEVMSTSTRNGILYVKDGYRGRAIRILRCLGLVHTPSTPNKLEPPSRS